MTDISEIIADACAECGLDITGYQLAYISGAVREVTTSDAALIDALRRMIDPAPGVSQKLPAWAYGIAKAALAKAGA